MRLYKHHLLKIKFTFLIIATLCVNSSACTIFYLSNDSLILAGNNEDWKDPASKMWFYPGEQGKLGWVKFGWGSGFPQGGINEKGLFWDATSGPYLAMPDAESHKEKYPGPLMQKIIEECADVEDAKFVLSGYYCEDQYKAQYLIGDAGHHAVIVEGDSIITMSDDYLILTNFYHSHPELGGYPCWRYDLAKSIVEECGHYSAYVAGSILSATHQEGKYPTQYSQIYDLINLQFYLFYYHNYEEFILINLNNELKKGPRSFDIPGLFAGITLSEPEETDIVAPGQVGFTWTGKAGFSYELRYSTDPEFSEYGSSHVKAKRREAKGNLIYLYLLAGFILPAFLIRKKGRRLIPGLLLVIGFSTIHCTKEENPEVNNPEIITLTVTGLQPATTYFWKVCAHPIESYEFQSETVIKQFTTSTE